MIIQTPFLFRFLGYIKNKIDNYPYSKKIFYSLKKNSIFFIQIGANDGLSEDPIKDYSNNWSGILIEPIPYIFEVLKKNYSISKNNLIFENIAISNYDGIMNFFLPKEAKKNTWLTKISSCDRFNGDLSNYETEEILVPCLTLDSLLIKYNINKIDLLIIDVEGYENVILDAYSFKIKPQIIFLETRFYNYSTLEKMYAKFINMGYRIFPEKDNTLLILRNCLIIQ